MHLCYPVMGPEFKCKLMGIWHGPFIVTEGLGDVNYRLIDKHDVVADTPAHVGDLMSVNDERP